MTVQFGSRQLLVSVRNVPEAQSALAGGADIIDVKEPAHGSLGRAEGRVIGEIVRAVQQRSTPPLVSAALGEVNEFDRTDGFRLPEGVSYAKLGLSHLRNDTQWVDRWNHVRGEYQRSRRSSMQWIAVIYADELAAESPPAEEIIAAAIETQCVGVLVDTWSKSGGHLLDTVSPALLDRWAMQLHNAGLFFAVAGRLTLELLRQLREVSADVFAVRSAACEGDDRQAAVNSQRVSDLRAAIDRLPDPNSPTDTVSAASSGD